MTDDAARPPDLVEFCRRLHPQLVGTLTLVTGDRHVAEELTQEALIRVWNRWDDVATKESPEGWTHRVAINLATSWFRRRRAERRATRRLQREPAPSSVDRADVIAVRAAVAALPERQRLVVALRFYGGLSVKDTAEVLGCAEGTIKSHTAKATARLRAALGEHQDGEHRPAAVGR